MFKLSADIKFYDDLYVAAILAADYLNVQGNSAMSPIGNLIMRISGSP